MAIDPVALRAFQEEARKRGYSPAQINRVSQRYIQEQGGQMTGLSGFVNEVFINPVRRGAEALGEAGERGAEFLTNRAVAEAGGFQGFGPEIAGRRLFAPKTPITEEERQAAAKDILNVGGSRVSRMTGGVLRPMSEQELKSPAAIAESVARRGAGTAAVLGSFATGGLSTIPAAAKTGAVLSGLATAGAGGDVGEIAGSAALGAGMGVGGKLLGSAYQKGKGAVSRMAQWSQKKAGRLSQAIEKDIMKPRVPITPEFPLDVEKKMMKYKALGIDTKSSATNQANQMARKYLSLKDTLENQVFALDQKNIGLPKALSTAGRVKAALRQMLSKKGILYDEATFNNYLNRLGVFVDDNARIKPSDLFTAKIRLGNILGDEGVFENYVNNVWPDLNKQVGFEIWKNMDDIISKFGPEIKKTTLNMSTLWDLAFDLYPQTNVTAWLGKQGIGTRSTLLGRAVQEAEGLGAKFFSWVGRGKQPSMKFVGAQNIDPWQKKLLLSVPPLTGTSARGLISGGVMEAGEPIGQTYSPEEIMAQAQWQNELAQKKSPDGLWQWDDNQGWIPTEEHYNWMLVNDVMNHGGKNITKINALKKAYSPEIDQLDAVSKRKLNQLRLAKAVLGQYKQMVDDMNVPDSMAQARVAGYLRKWTAVLRNEPEITTFDKARNSTASMLAQAFGEVGMKTEGDIARAQLMGSHYTMSKSENERLLNEILSMINNAEAAIMSGANLSPTNQTPSLNFNPAVSNSLPITPGLTP